jgi:hypothetical protein
MKPKGDGEGFAFTKPFSLKFTIGLLLVEHLFIYSSRKIDSMVKEKRLKNTVLKFKMRKLTSLSSISPTLQSM